MGGRVKPPCSLGLPASAVSPAHYEACGSTGLGVASLCANLPLAPAAHSSLHCLPALQPPEEPTDKSPEAEDLLGVERTPSGRVRRTSAQVAVFHLQEIAEDELARDWTKRRMKDDLVPETARVSCPPSIVDSAVASGRDMPWPEPWDSRPVTWATRCPRHLWRVLPAAVASVACCQGECS